MSHATHREPVPLPQFPSSRPSCTLCPLHLVARHVGIGLHHLPDSLPLDPSHHTLLVVGQNPGYHENACGTPFVGKSGQVLQSVYLDAARALTACSVFVTNTARCFHVHGNDPPNSAYAACSPYLLKDISFLLRNSARLSLLLLGGPAVTYTLKLLTTIKKPNLSLLLSRQGLTVSFPPPPRTKPKPRKSKKSTPSIPPPAPAPETAPESPDGTTASPDGCEDGRGEITIFATYHPAYMLRDLNAAHAIGGHMHLLHAHLYGTSPLPSRPQLRSYREPPQSA